MAHKVIRNATLCVGIVSIWSCSGPFPASSQPTGALPLAVPVTSPSPLPASVGMDEALGWRDTYGDLLNKPKDAALERYGQPTGTEGEAIGWRASDRTKGRDVAIFLKSEREPSIVAVKVYARATENLDPLELIKRARLFEFSSGTYADTVTDYFAAVTKDKRNTFQFSIRDNRIRFERMVFFVPEYFSWNTNKP